MVQIDWVNTYIYTRHSRKEERRPLYKPVWPTKGHLYWKQEWVQVSLSTTLKRPCATYVLWRKQTAGNIHIYNTYVRTKWILESTNLFVDLPILKYILILSLNLQQPSLYIFYMYITYFMYYTYLLYMCYRVIDLMSRVFANGPGDRGSSRVIPMTQKMVLDTALLI